MGKAGGELSALAFRRGVVYRSWSARFTDVPWENILRTRPNDVQYVCINSNRAAFVEVERRRKVLTTYLIACSTYVSNHHMNGLVEKMSARSELFHDWWMMMMQSSYGSEKGAHNAQGGLLLLKWSYVWTALIAILLHTRNRAIVFKSCKRFLRQLAVVAFTPSDKRPANFCGRIRLSFTVWVVQ